MHSCNRCLATAFIECNFAVLFMVFEVCAVCLSCAPY